MPTPKQSNKDILPQPASIVKPAAIWARVSTHDQAEKSLPGQVSRCKEKLEKLGYSVIHTFSVDWGSMDLYACPDFQQLRYMIRNREIQAFAIYDRDRLEAKGLQGLVFFCQRLTSLLSALFARSSDKPCRPSACTVCTESCPAF